MRARARRLLIAALSLAGLWSTSLGSVGCTDQEGQTFFVAFNQVLQNNCNLTAAGGQISVRPRGRLDIALTNEYNLFLSIRNSMVPSNQATGNKAENLFAENNNIQIIGGRVKYKIGDIGIDLPQNQFVFTSGTVAPAGTSLILFQGVPPLVGEFLRSAPNLAERYSYAELILQITLEGRLQDGTVVKSREFIYPIDVCNGCLVQYTVAPELCCDPASWQLLTFPCYLGQDVGVDCRSCCASALTDEEKLACLPP